MDKPMMKIEDVVGDIVLLIMDNNEALKDLGYDQKTLYTKVTGYDEYGLWVSHPGLKIPKLPTEDEVKAGKVPAQPDLQTVQATVLIPWPFIVSIVHFPEVEGFDFPSPFDQNIGFEIDHDAGD